jgi:uncharacterized membrane protein
MSDDDTLAGITEELQPCPSTEVVYAWGEAEDEPETDDLPSGVSYRSVIAVTALAAVALAIAAVAAVVSLISPAPQPSRYNIRPRWWSTHQHPNRRQHQHRRQRRHL